MGICYAFLDRPKEDIERVYSKVPSFVRPNISWDKFALRKTKEWLKTKQFSKFQMVYLPAAQLYEGRQCGKSLKLLNESVSPLIDECDDDEKALYYFLKGANLKELKKFEEAVTELEKCIALKHQLKRETWTVPFAYMIMGESKIDIQPLDSHAILSDLKHAKSAKDYDFENIVPFRVGRAVDRLKLVQKGELSLDSNEKDIFNDLDGHDDLNEDNEKEINLKLASVEETQY